MSERAFFKNYKIGLATLAIFFICLSITIHLFQNYFLFRLLRGIICYSTLFYLVIAQGRNIQKWIKGFLFFYGASSVATVWYENGTMASISMILNFIAFLMLLWHIIPKINFKKISKTFSILFILIIIVNGYLFFQLIQMMKEMILSSTQYIFMLLDAICGISLVFLALLYNHFCNNAKSMSFMVLVFLLIFGEIFRSIAYYNLGDSTLFVYLARIFFVLSLYTLVHFSFLDVKNVNNIKTSTS